VLACASAAVGGIAFVGTGLQEITAKRKVLREQHAANPELAAAAAAAADPRDLEAYEKAKRH